MRAQDKSVPNEPVIYLGLAITRDAVETEIGGQSLVMLNAPEGHLQLLVRLRQITGPLRIVCERAAGAERLLIQSLHEGGFTVGMASTEDICLSAGVSDASEITPQNLTRYATAYPERVRFIEGSAKPQALPRSHNAQTKLRTRIDSRRRPLVRLATWLASGLGALRPRRVG